MDSISGRGGRKNHSSGDVAVQGRANREARLDASDETGLSANLASRASTAVDPDKDDDEEQFANRALHPTGAGVL
jgi:hypothetical protein